MRLNGFKLSRSSSSSEGTDVFEFTPTRRRASSSVRRPWWACGLGLIMMITSPSTRAENVQPALEAS
jgi:hypothetical protein